MEQFTNRYQVNKTLRFKLKPTEETKQLLKIKWAVEKETKRKSVQGSEEKKMTLLKQDEKRIENYRIAKIVIDRFHRSFINEVLGNLAKDEEFKKMILDHIQDKSYDALRKYISEAFQHNVKYDKLFGKMLFNDNSPLFSDYAKSEKEREALDTFKSFTTFFAFYNTNRKNMYIEKAQNTAIAYRIINVNLPKFDENIKIYETICDTPLINEELSKNRELKRRLNGATIDNIFQLSYYTNVLTQTGIDQYNEIIGMINEQIKLHNDKLPKKKEGIDLMHKLHKQILGYKEGDVGWRVRGFSNDKELLQAVQQFYDKYSQEIAYPLKNLLEELYDYDLSRIYLHHKSLKSISRIFYNDGEFIIHQIITQKPDETNEDYSERLKKSKRNISIQDINKKIKPANLCNYFAQHVFIDEDDQDKKKDIFGEIEKSYERVRDLLESAKAYQKKRLAESNREKELKKLLDNLKTLQHFVQALRGNGGERNKDLRFYGRLEALWSSLYELTPLYDCVRNHMTKKPFSQDKIKLYFDVKKGNFLTGWEDSQTKSDNGTQNGGYLFRKRNAIGEYDYYLGICANSKLFREKEGACGVYERLDYKQVLSKSFTTHHYNGDYEKDEQSLRDVICSFVKNIATETETMDVFKENDTPSTMLKKLKLYSQEEYNNLLEVSDFKEINRTVTNNLKESLLSLDFPEVSKYRDSTFNLFMEVQDIIYEVCQKEKTFRYFIVDDKEIIQAQKEDAKHPFLLFKISNKDLSYAEKKTEGKRTSRGKENLHTMYFKALMEGGYDTFDIGSGSVYFRKKSIQKEVTHKAGVPIDNKNEFVRKKHPTRTLKYNLIKDKRYTEDIYLFHLSVTINYQKPKPNNNFIYELNRDVQNYLRQHMGEVNIIGIDRGERHLIYATVIDSSGEIVEEPRSYNIIGKDGFDYSKKLKSIAKDRTEARKNWSTMARITDTKKGYLSQVVHEIVNLAIKHHAIIVIEGLGRDFERMHSKIEYKVYRQFENMLIQKLSYLAFKSDAPSATYGNIANGLQLAVPTSEDRMRQNGWVFYIPPAYTSKIDPETGFASIINLKEAKKDLRKFFGAFDSIYFDCDLLHFIINYDRDGIQCVARSPQRVWRLTSHGERIENGKSKNLTEEFKRLFRDAEFPLEQVSKDSVCKLDDENLLRFFALFNLMLQMRNSFGEDDYIISPVESEMPFITNESNPKGIRDADANGAYCIALKGLYWLNKDFPLNDKGNLTTISHEEWFGFLQERNKKQ